MERCKKDKKRECTRYCLGKLIMASVFSLEVELDYNKTGHTIKTWSAWSKLAVSKRCVKPGVEGDVPAVPGACAAAGAAAGLAGSGRCRWAGGRPWAACVGLRTPGAAPWGGSSGPAWARSCPAPSEPAPRTAGRTPEPSAPSGCSTPGWGRSLGRQLGSAEIRER